jgi:hypothetical protein
MSKRVSVVIICVNALALVAIVCFFGLAKTGQKLWYDTFGGKNLHLTSDNSEKELFWFDVWHTNDPNDPIFGRIEDSFNNFKPDLVLVEGSSDMFEGNRYEAILEGESAFATYLAKHNSVAVEDIEPPFSAQIAYLQTKYQPEQILAMYHIRQIGSIQDKAIDMNFDFNDYLINETQFLVDNGLGVEAESLEEILGIINSYLPKSIDSETWKDERSVFAVYNDLIRGKGELAPVYLDIYNSRNIWLVDLICERQAEYDRIFIVMGGQHLIDTREQLKEVYGS